MFFVGRGLSFVVRRLLLVVSYWCVSFCVLCSLLSVVCSDVSWFVDCRALCVVCCLVVCRMWLFVALGLLFFVWDVLFVV